MFLSLDVCLTPGAGCEDVAETEVSVGAIISMVTWREVFLPASQLCLDIIYVRLNH